VTGPPTRQHHLHNYRDCTRHCDGTSYQTASSTQLLGLYQALWRDLLPDSIIYTTTLTVPGTVTGPPTRQHHLHSYWDCTRHCDGTSYQAASSTQLLELYQALWRDLLPDNIIYTTTGTVPGTVMGPPTRQHHLHNYWDCTRNCDGTTYQTTSSTQLLGQYQALWRDLLPDSIIYTTTGTVPDTVTGPPTRQHHLQNYWDCSRHSDGTSYQTASFTQLLGLYQELWRDLLPDSITYTTTGIVPGTVTGPPTRQHHLHNHWDCSRLCDRTSYQTASSTQLLELYQALWWDLLPDSIIYTTTGTVPGTVTGPPTRQHHLHNYWDCTRNCDGTSYQTASSTQLRGLYQQLCTS
jgi:hypothetical protein